MSDFWLTDTEVDDMCAGLSQDAAKIRFLRRLGLRVDRKPNGRPLAWRPQAPPDEPVGADGNTSIVTDLQAWAAQRKEPRGQKAKGR